MWASFLFVLLLSIWQVKADCPAPSVTKASGTHAPKGKICPGDLIFEDNFDSLDLNKWRHEKMTGPGYNGEFQAYVNERSVSWVEGGKLLIKPALLSDNKIKNPVKSAYIHTIDSFSFTYGKVEVNAKLPAGDWLWPAIWMLPRDYKYGSYPASGEIDIMESRGNKQMTNAQGLNIGSQQMSSTLHWGPNPQNNQFLKTHYERQNGAGWDTAFHKYQFEWTPQHIIFRVDGQQLGIITPPKGGFWELGQFDKTHLPNPWSKGTKMAPFDQAFYLIMNLAVGSTNSYFPEDVKNPGGKPWKNSSPNAMEEFSKGRNQWLPTWNLNTNNAALQIDYVRVWAI